VRRLFLAALLVPAGLQAQSTSTVETLLRLRQQARVAHVLGDARLLTEGFSSNYRELNHGSWSRPTREEAERRFSRYFASVRFLEWEDVRPPIVSVSPDSQWAEILVNKRVRTIPAGAGGTESAERYVWLERWTRVDTTWQLATIASTDRPEPDSSSVPLADRARAWSVLRRARQVMGGDAAVARISAVEFTAQCQGPRRAFRTHVLSARDGRVLFAQDFPDSSHYRAGISLQGGWERGTDGRAIDSLPLATETVVRAHELLVLAFAPESRYTAPRVMPDDQLDGRKVNVVRFRDAAGAPVDFLFDGETGRPEGYRPVDHSGKGAGRIEVRFSDWRPAGALQLPRLVTMTVGSDVFRYQVIEVSTDWIEDSRFRG
jgi:hypothetical protein